EDELNTLCFSFGVELDEVVQQEEETVFKIEVPANRRRTLASIGTYDLSLLSPPFTYERLPLNDICFQPLGCGDLPPMKGPQILSHFAAHPQLKQYLHMLEGESELYVLRDSKKQYLSLPPLINSNFCRLTEQSVDIFVDCTSVEEKKGDMALMMVVSMLAEYCEDPFTVEPVRVLYEEENKEKVTPVLETREMCVDMKTVRRICGLPQLTAADAAKELHRLMLAANPKPPNEADFLQHQWDSLPVLLSNAKTRELTETRTQLISGLLRSLVTNAGRREMPIRLFEVGDVVIRDDRTETGSRNLLYCCAAFADEHGSGLEEVHGLLDAALEALGLVADYIVAERQAAANAGKGDSKSSLMNISRLPVYSLKPTQLPTFLPGRQVQIVVQRKCRAEGEKAKETELNAKETAKETQEKFVIGQMGTLHVDCLRAFGLSVPVSVVEFTLEPFLQWLPETDIIFA
ncbi:phenylalanyl-tRNA synthetase beta chain, putative, partial [Eimeria acervulina]